MSEGPLGDEIVIGVTTAVTGDVATAISEIFEQVRQATARGGDLGAIALPPIDSQILVQSVRTALSEVESTVSQVAGNIGARLSEGFGGENLFASQKEALADLRLQWERFGVELEEITSGNPLSRRGAAATSGLGVVDTMQRAQAQYAQGQRSGNYDDTSAYYSEESRRAIQSGQITPPPSQQEWLRQVGGSSYQQGDMERVISRIQASIGKVALDGVEYSFNAETGQFKQGRANVTDEATIARLQQQLITTLARNAETAVRSMAAELATQPGVVDLGANPLSRVGPTDLATHELAAPIASSQTPQQVESVVQSLLREMHAIGAEAEQTAPQIQRLVQILAEVREAAAQPFAEEYRAGRQAQLETAFPPRTDAAAAFQERALAQQRLQEEYASRQVALPSAPARLAITAAPSSRLDASGIAARTAEFSKQVEEQTQREIANFRELNNAVELSNQQMLELESRGVAAMDAVAASTRAAETSVDGLSKLVALTGEQLVKLSEGAKLTREELAGLREAGSTFGGKAAVTDPAGKFVFPLSASGALTGDSIAREEALIRLQMQAQQDAVKEAGAAAGGGGEGGFVSHFVSGLGGGASGGGNSLERVQKAGGEFLGSIARYQLAYAAIYDVQRAITGAISEQIKFEDAQVPLQAALDGTRASLTGVASEYAQVGTASGQSASAGVQAGTQGIFAFGAQGRPDAQTVGLVSARAAMVGVVLTGQELTQVQQELIASTNAFNLGFEGQSRILDAATNAYHHYGEATGSILQALPAVAEQARQAGLSVEQTANLISLVGERTQATGEAAGTALGRIFVQMQSNNYQLQARSLGIDTTATQGHQLEQLAQKWHTLDAAQQNALVHSLTGARGASALIAILEDGGKALDQNASAYGAAGAAQEEYYRQLGTLGGELKIISGDFSQLSKDLAQSGAGDLFGLAIRTIDPFLHGLDDILKVFDAIDGSTHHLIGTVVELAAVYALLAKAAGSAAVAEGEAATVNDAGLLSRIGTRLRSPFSRGGGAAAAAGGEDLEAGLGVGAADTGLAVGGAEAGGAALLGPVGIAIAGGLALTTVLGGLTESAKRQTDAHDEAIQAERALFSATTADQFKTAASDLATASVDLRHAGSGFFGTLGGGVDHGQISRDAANAAYAEHIAAAISEYQAKQAEHGGGANAFFTDTNDFTNNIRTGLNSMVAAGVPATRQLQLLNQALHGTAATAQGTAQTLNNPLLQRGFVSTIGNLNLDTNQQTYGRFGRIGGGQQFSVGQQLDAGQIEGFINSALQRRGFQPGQGGVVSTADQQAIIAQVTPQIIAAFGESLPRGPRHGFTLTPGDAASAKQAISQALTSLFSNQAANPNLASGLRDPNDVATFFQGALDPTDTTGKTRLTSGFQNIQNQFAESQNALNPAQSAAGAHAAITTMRTALDAAKRFNPAVYEAYASQGYALIQQWVKQVGDNIAAVATAAGRNQSPEAAARSAAQGIEHEAEFFVKQGDTADLVALLDSANSVEIDAIKQYFQQRLKDARDALAAAQQQLQSDLKELSSLGGELLRADPEIRQGILGPDNAATNAARAGVRKLERELKLLTGSNYTGTDQTADAKAQIAEAQALANARPGDAVSQAQAQLASDRIALSVAKAKGDLAGEASAQTAINNDLLSLHQAQSALAQAIDSSNAISGDPVSQAATELQSAADTLAAAVPGTADYFNALKSFHDAQYQMQEALIEAHYQGNLARIDQTNPVATAAAQVRRDRAQLRYDRSRGAGTDVLNTDVATLHRDTATEQSNKFSQSMADMQNAYNLQEISASAYIKFLDHERDVLSRIKDRTRQQTEELQQVDQALKSVADTMDGQFNIGDIRIPTPYEAERYITAHGQGLGYQATTVTHSSDNRHYHLDFKGLDKREIEELLGYLIGSGATHRSGTATRKGM